MSAADQQPNSTPKRVIGRPFPPGTSGNLNGRPRNVVSPTVALRKALTPQAANEIAAKIVNLARSGDPTAIKTIFDRLDSPLSGLALHMESSIVSPATSSETQVTLLLPRNFTEAVRNGERDEVVDQDQPVLQSLAVTAITEPDHDQDQDDPKKLGAESTPNLEPQALDQEHQVQDVGAISGVDFLLPDMGMTTTDDE